MAENQDDFAAGFAASQHGDPDPEIVTERPTAKQEGGDDWKQRYMTLEGKYRAEVPDLARQKRDAEARTAELEAQIKALTTKPAPAETGEEAPEVVAFREEYPTHAQVIDLTARKAAQQAVEEATTPLQKEVETLTERLERQARESHFTAIAAAHRDWQEHLPAIQTWADGLTDPEKRERANATLNGGSAFDVVDLFTTFKRETGIAEPRPQPQPNAIRPGSSPIVGAPMDDEGDLAAGYRMSTQRK